MNCRVEIADQAKSDLFDTYEWIALDSRLKAARWIAELEASTHGLDQISERCVVAPENEGFEDHEIRHLIVGRYRVI